ncbi:MAG: hypothetical protein K6A82_05790 [Prevotella sp.]|nr:hypothetical protein [Prevotella sp.]
MKKILLTLIFMLASVTAAQAQFTLTGKNGNQRIPFSNLHFNKKEGQWTLNGIPISQIDKISRTTYLPTDTISLDRNVGGMYFGDVWKEGYADYYFILANDEIGQTSGEHSQLAPQNPGGYILYVDVWGAVSADHHTPIIPEGTYTLSDRRANGAATTEYTLATLHKVDNSGQHQLRDILFSNGQVTVKHITGGYDITASFTTKDGQKLNFHYTGAVTLQDQSGETDDTGEFITKDVNILPAVANFMLYDQHQDYDNYVLRFFSTNELTADKLHNNRPGLLLTVDIYTAKGAGIGGTYQAGTMRSNYAIREQPGVYFPGIYLGSQPLGSFCEQVNNDLSVSTCLAKDGIITISPNADGTYTVNANLTSDKGKKITLSWTGSIIQK